MISEMLGQGYDISAIKLISFTHASAAEFLEVYKGVVPFYNDKVQSLGISYKRSREMRS